MQGDAIDAAPAAPLLDELARKFRAFSELHCAHTPLYRAITAAMAEDERVLAMVARIPEEQRVPNLLLAAVHDRLLAGADHPLADFYPSVRGATGRDPAQAGEPFVAFCKEHEAELVPVLATRATQTNEVGRAAIILPVLARLRAEGIERVALIDLGTSAGLNLCVDRYGVEYSNGLRAGDTSSTVVVRSELLGARAPSFASGLPTIVARKGIDRSPLDLDRDEDQRWLLACVWPDQLERFARLRAAIAIAKEARPRVARGVLPGDVEAQADGIDAGAHVVFLTTWVLAYLSGAERDATDAAISRVGTRRDATWLIAEVPPKLPITVEGFEEHDTVLATRAYRSGVRIDTTLARVHGHGTFVEWRVD